MSKKVSVGILLVLVLLLVAGNVVSADTPGNGSNWISGFFVKNKSTTDDANIQMQFFKENDGTAAYTVSRTVAKGDTKFFYLGAGGDLNGDITDSGEYSVVISSDQEVAAVVNSTSSGTGQSTTSFDGVSNPASKLYAPNILSNYYGYSTNFYLQNAGTSDASVTIKYFDATGAEIASMAETVSIPAGSFIKRDQSGVAGIPVNTVASATFECSGCQLAGVVNIVDDSSASFPGVGTANYVMYSTGSTTAYAPAVYNNYYGFNSSINIQNNGTGAVDVQITFSDGTTIKASDAAPGLGGTLGEGQAWSVYLPLLTGLDSGNTNGALAATIEVLSPVAGNSVVVLVNTSNTNDASFASYNGVDGGAQTIYASAANALAYNVAQGYFTSITCQNLGSSATDLTYTWSGLNTKSGYVSVSGSGNMSNIAGAPATIAPGESFVLLPNVDSHRTGIGNMPVGFDGSVKVTASENISCIVNQNLLGGSSDQDNLGAYTARP